jgi:hypothetical protein
MDRETMRTILREQKAGYDTLHKFEVEEWRAATFADKLRDLADLMAFSRAVMMRPAPDTGAVVRERWQLIRERHEQRSQ